MYSNVYLIFQGNSLISVYFLSPVCHSEHCTHNNYWHVSNTVPQRTSSQFPYDWSLYCLLHLGLAHVYSGNSIVLWTCMHLYAYTQTHMHANSNARSHANTHIPTNTHTPTNTPTHTHTHSLYVTLRRLLLGLSWTQGLVVAQLVRAASPCS